MLTYSMLEGAAVQVHMKLALRHYTQSELTCDDVWFSQRLTLEVLL